MSQERKCATVQGLELEILEQHFGAQSSELSGLKCHIWDWKAYFFMLFHAFRPGARRTLTTKQHRGGKCAAEPGIEMGLGPPSRRSTD